MTKFRVLELQDVLEAARAVAARLPQTANPLVDGYTGDCAYTCGSGHCFVGQVFTDLKVPLPAEDDFNNVVGIERLVPWLNERGVGMTPRAVEFLKTAQDAADKGSLWGEAFSLAEGNL